MKTMINDLKFGIEIEEHEVQDYILFDFSNGDFRGEFHIIDDIELNKIQQNKLAIYDEEETESNLYDLLEELGLLQSDTTPYMWLVDVANTSWMWI